MRTSRPGWRNNRFSVSHAAETTGDTVYPEHVAERENVAAAG